MPVTILQISDLHRDTNNPIKNDPLIASLEIDMKKYLVDETTKIPKPDLLFVTGDIIQGVKPGTSDHEQKLDEQYLEATEFLNKLAHTFLGGNRDRVILIPGNHDVSACHARDSFKEIEITEDRRGEIVRQLFSPASEFRWDWNKFTVHKISDQKKYDMRLAAFSKFYTNFYGGKRSYSLDPAKQFDLFDFPEFELTIVGFSSCHNNDILNKPGMIHPQSSASAGLCLRKADLNGRTKIALWHHNTEGKPQQNDYMDAGSLQNLMGCGFVLGFHGHQHKPQFIQENSRYGGNERMTVISAGTLCGSASYRFARSYNIIELDTKNSTGKLHLREMQNDDFSFPIWGCRAFPPSNENSMPFDFSPPATPEVSHNELLGSLLAAQKAMLNGNVPYAIEIAEDLQRDNVFVRKILAECYSSQNDNSALIALIDIPNGASEAIVLMDALWGEGKKELLKKLLLSPTITDSNDTSVKELCAKYLARLQK